jgi:hypothetical protein
MKLRDEIVIGQEATPPIVYVDLATWDTLGAEIASLDPRLFCARLRRQRLSWPPYLRDAEWEDDDWYPENDGLTLNVDEEGREDRDPSNTI